MPALLSNTPIHSKDSVYARFASELESSGFMGEIDHTEAQRTVFSTDNSIYQRFPQLVVFPTSSQDVELVARLSADMEFRTLEFNARGGGTGTNGQSLSRSVVVDMSRHMNAILDIDVENRRVRVQSGVVKDQLNAALKPYGLFFAPELSTSNRATLGGMINTDASGQGSCEYGKTRDHVISLDTVLPGGERFEAKVFELSEEEELVQKKGTVGRLIDTTRTIFDRHHDAILERFPPLNRFLTGYDLAHLRDEKGRLDLRSLLCGSEGSLGFIVEATLNVLPLPKHSALVNVRYTSFMDALRDATALMKAKTRPTSIETVDSKVLGLAMQDMVWEQVAPYFPEGETPTAGINLVEFNAETAAELEEVVTHFQAHLDSDPAVERLGNTVAWGRTQMSTLYAMRKRSVGLLGNVEGEKRPIPFVEDTAVPPEKLADYIADFRDLLDHHQLSYGMFGHVDAGVLHVRPAIDMKDPEQATLIRTISDEVVKLTQHYGGLLWGEHGKGVRSEYSPAFFGPLYPLLQEIKTACDPYNQMNPGKIATPLPNREEPTGSIEHSSDAHAVDKWQLLKIDEVPTRGERDRQLDRAVWQYYGAAMHCNGNGACFNYDPNDAMCPSWKGTRNRIHSPKGRATLFKEWLLRQQQASAPLTSRGLSSPQHVSGIKRIAHALKYFPERAKATWRRHQGKDSDNFSHEVYDAMAGCLACKSCAGQCPVKVSVPDFRSEFLSLYHQRYLRAPRDYVVASLEAFIPYLAPIAAAYNTVTRWHPVSRSAEKVIGLVDMPALTRAPLAKQLTAWGIETATPERLNQLSDVEKKRSLVIVQDAFTTYFDTAVVRDIIELLKRLNVHVFVSPYAANGKPLQVYGFLDRFRKVADQQSSRLNALADTGVELVGIDPAMTLVYRQEYPKALPAEHTPKVALLQEWLASRKDEIAGALKRKANTDTHYRLMAHCTEKTTAAGAVSAWQTLFETFGLTLSIENTGCCGMSGTYGHETRNRETSKHIYALSWEPKVESTDNNEQLLVTGYSCRSQVKRFSQTVLEHPLQALLREHRIMMA